MNKSFAFAACALLAGIAAVAAQGMPPLHPSPPPGKIVQSLGAYLAGDAMHGRYRVLTSRESVGMLHQTQWYFSIYAPGAARDLLRVYQSPANDDGFGIVPRLERGHGTDRLFPNETVTIVGKGELMGGARDEVLVLVRAFSGDCGGFTLSILDAYAGAVHLDAQVSNSCALSASIAHGGVVLHGPYYNASAPLCCPTKANATAILRYRNGRWIERPNYFKLTVSQNDASAVTPLTHATPLFTPIFKPIVTTPKPSGAPMPPARSILRQ